jgi:hypothetical protein
LESACELSPKSSQNIVVRILDWLIASASASPKGKRDGLCLLLLLLLLAWHRSPIASDVEGK